MIRVIHVSDLHFHRSVQKNSNAVALLARIRASFPFGPTDSNYLLVTGDLTDDGEPEQYRQVREALSPFRGRLLLCPGNHDYGPLGNLYEEASARFFDEDFLPSLDIGDRFVRKEPVVTRLRDGDGANVVLIGLNSVLETTRSNDFARGGIGPEQLERLHALLSLPADPGEMRLVYLHHRPQRCNWFLELTDSEDLMAVLHNRVQVVAFGHSGRGDEPPQARTMNVQARRYGVKYFLNANASVDSQSFYEIVFTAGQVVVKRG